MADIKKKRITDLPQATTIESLLTLGVDNTGKSVKVPINLLKGNKGDKGDAPSIGANGNWWISGIDTGKPARGEDGTNLSNKTMYNVSQANNNYAYTTTALARAAVTTTLRALGQIIVYKLATGVWVCEQFIGAALGTWGTEAYWKSIGEVTATDLAKKASIINSNNDTVCYFKRETDGIVIDITARAKQNIAVGKAIIDNTGVINQNWSYGTIICMKLDENSTYELDGINFGSATIPTVNLYSSNPLLGAIPRTKGIYNPTPPSKMTFTTDNLNLWITYYIKIEGWSSANFDSSETFTLKKTGTTIEKIVDNDGVLLHDFSRAGYVEKETVSEVVTIPANLLLTNYFINWNVGQEGLIGTWNTPTTLLSKLPLEKGFWYYIDLGVSTGVNNTILMNWAFVHSVNTNTRSVFRFPISGSKNQIYADGDLKYLSLYVKIESGVTSGLLHYDATNTIKIIKSRKPIKGFNTDIGFVDLKSIKGASDLSDSDNLFFGTPKSLMIYQEWGSNLGISKDVRVTKDFELYFDGVYLNGKSQTGWQGSSSLLEEFKNTKHKFFRKDGVTKMNMKFENQIQTNERHIKSNPTDFTSVNNSAMAALVQMVYDSYPLESRYPWSTAYNPTESNLKKRFDTGARAHIDAIPCLYFDNGATIGYKHFNILSERNNFMMEKNNPNHRLYKSIMQQKFDHAASKAEWEEINTGKDGIEIADEDFIALSNWVNWVRNTSSSNGDFKTQASEWMDVRSFIDYYIIMFYLLGADSWGNNMYIGTYNGKKMTVFFYDGDNCFGQVVRTFQPTNAEFTNNLGGATWGWATPTNSTLWSKFQTAFMLEIRERFAYLDSNNIIKPNVVRDMIKNKFEKIVPFQALEINANNFPNTGTNRDGVYASYQRIYEWLEGRYAFIKTKFQ